MLLTSSIVFAAGISETTGAAASAEAEIGMHATAVVKSITKTSADDNILLIFISFTSCDYEIRLPISEKIAIMNVTILITRLENRIAMNMITTIAAIVPSTVITFFPIE